MPQHLARRSAVLLVNLGSPAEPTTPALRAYLAEFLSDPRVIDLPRWQWWPILYGIILRRRPKRSAALYRKIWLAEGAPLLVITRRQRDALGEKLRQCGHESILVEYAMRYGEPSIASRLAALKGRGVDQMLVIPMYPQYADSTTASVFDGVAQALARTRYLPEVRFVHHWHDDPHYIAALAASFTEHCAQHGQPERLLLSFHGVPRRYLDSGDPYFCFCHRTARLLTRALAFPAQRIQLVFQSRFGREEWLKPYADETLVSLAAQGVKHIAVMCPGFVADCLETLEEMAIANRALFLDHGGERYDYIAALNDSPAQIDLLYRLICRHTQDWPRFAHGATADAEAAATADRRARSWQATQRAME